MLEKIRNINLWIEEKNIDVKERQRREAIHIILSAIANSNLLQASMTIKGGVLLAIKYSSSRHTTDVDFSTSMEKSNIAINSFRQELDNNLILLSEELAYGMNCIVQKFRQNPKDPEATYPTFQITIGYAYKRDRNSFKRLQRKNSSDTIKIDYSFNEMIFATEQLELSEGKFILTYSYVDLLSEKYRAILQQEQRQRSRAQDIYDIYYILKNFETPDEQLKKDILDTLINKSTSRELSVNKSSISDPIIVQRSETKYKTIEHTINEELPAFKETYYFIQNFYESLPWEQYDKF